MKGFLRKAAAVLLVAVMAVAMLAGCSKSAGKKVNAGGADSMFGVLKSGMQLEKKTFECDITADVSGTSVNINLSGASDGNATSLSAEVSAGGMSFKLDNVIVFTDDIVYINVASVMDEVGTFASAMMGGSFDLEALGITSDWVSFEAEGLFKQDTSFFETISNDLDEAYANLITEKDGTYSITVSDEDSVKAFIDATKKLLEDNGDSWAKLLANKANAVDTEKLVNGLVDDIANAVAKAFKDSTGEAMPDEYLNEFKEGLLEQANVSEVEQMDEESYKELLDGLKESLELAEAKGLDGTIDVRTSYDKGVYTIKANIESDAEQENITMVTTVTDDSSAKVEIPSDAQPIVDIIAAVLAANFLMQ